MADRKTNPNNPQNNLFRKLTRLLSGPLQTYRKQDPRRIGRNKIDKFADRFKSTSGQQFKRADEHHSAYGNMTANYMSNQNRAERYVDFDQMEYMPEIASAMDIYADEISTSSELNKILTVKTYDEEIKLELENLMFKILNIEFNLFGWARSMCKFGDFFLYLDIDEEEGVKYAVALPSAEIERLEGEDEHNPNYVQYQWNSGGLTLENWQVAHFRILGNDKYAPYGTSILEPARRIWRQLTLMEDAVMAYRIVRSPERRVFYIDVGNIAPQDIEQYMQKVMTQMKRNQIVDPNTGQVDLRYNPLSVEEDYFVPIRGGQNSRIESLPGGQYTGDIDDIKYLRDKLFSALKIPASYLSRGDGSDEDKSTLAQKDIRFARTVQRLQRSVVSELEKICIVHLFTRGYRGSDLTSFQLKLNNPSKLAQLQELESWRTKFEVASAATEGYFSKRWVAENLFNLSEKEFVRMNLEMFHDKKYTAALEKAAEDIISGTGGELGDLGAGPGESFGSDTDLDDIDLGDDEASLDPTAEDDSVLLATPEPEGEGSRDETTKVTGKNIFGKKVTTTDNSKSKWYMPKQAKDGGRGDNRHVGARRRRAQSMSGVSGVKAVDRNFLQGYSPLVGVGKMTMEDIETNYSREEDKILTTNAEIKRLIEVMERNKKEDEV
jgi:hypothetical protein